MRFLAVFLRLVFPPRKTEVLVENASRDALFSLICPTPLPISEVSITALLPYKHPLVRACILEVKFHHNKKAKDMLAAVLSDYLTEHIAELTVFGKKLAIIPVPLSAKRLRARGYNQTTEVCQNALTLLGKTNLLQEKILTRTKETRPQTTLARGARLQNMHGAFVATSNIDSSLTYMLIDDVSTTGATLKAAAAALHLAGAKAVLGVALAH